VQFTAYLKQSVQGSNFPYSLPSKQISAASEFAKPGYLRFLGMGISFSNDFLDCSGPIEKLKFYLKTEVDENEVVDIEMKLLASSLMETIDLGIINETRNQF